MPTKRSPDDLLQRPKNPDLTVMGNTRWEDWVIMVEWEVRAGVPTPIELHMAGAANADPPPYLTSDTLRRLPLRRVVQETRQVVADAMARNREWLPATLDALEGEQEEERNAREYMQMRVEHLAGPFATRATPGRVNPDYYRAVSRVYRTAVQAGEAPTKAVARWLAGASPENWQAHKSTAATAVSRARSRRDPATDRPYLPPTTKGRVGPVIEETP